MIMRMASQTLTGFEPISDEATTLRENIPTLQLSMNVLLEVTRLAGKGNKTCISILRKCRAGALSERGWK